MEIKELTKIGLTKGEVKIYSALLELGETTRTKLAKKSGVSASKIYDVSNRLIEKGLVSAVKRQGILHFSAAAPHRLNDLLEQKRRELEEEKKVVNELLPSLLLKYTQSEEEVKVEVFQGWEGMKTVFSEIANCLSKNDTSYVLGASRGQNSEQADIFFSQYYKQIDKKGYKIKIIFNENMRSYEKRIGYFVKSKLHEVRFLYQDTFTEINFYKDTVLFILLLRKPIVIRIKSKEAAHSFQMFFETIWKQAKK